MNSGTFPTFEERGVTIIVMQEPSPASGNLAWPATLEDSLALVSQRRGGGRAAVLTGTGTTFGPSFEATAPTDAKVTELSWLIDSLPVPIVSAVNGPAIGYACLVALLSDAAIGCEDASFVHPNRTTGVGAGSRLTACLGVRLGRVRAMEFIALGKPIEAATAAQWGLVEAVVSKDHLVARAVSRALELADDLSDLRRIRRLTGASLPGDGGAS